jgi:Terminase small subunit
MPALRDPRHERFAQAIADKRVSNAEAFRVAFDKANLATNVAGASASRLLRDVKVSARIAELKAQAEAASALSREQLVKFLVGVIRAKPSEASLENPHCEIAFSRSGKEAVFPNKLQAAAQLTRMCNWEAGQKITLEAGDSLSAFLREIVTK